MPRRAPTLTVLLLVALAGCAGAAPFADDGADTGTVSLYLSDEENAIDDFRHLNVTITKVGLKRADGNWSGRGGGGPGGHGDHDHRHRDRWVVTDVDNRTVDLTELRGPNATLLANLSIENGTYEKAFVHVSAVDATLENGTQVDVELPSGRLKVKDEFRVEGGTTVDFVVDVTVVERDDGYVIVPRVSESGTDVPVCRADGECRCGGQGGMNHSHDGHTHTHDVGCDCDGC
ncbi:DUF4382 domain-containing protein [Haloparvum sp. PAK95]|uniref:DUF4382 domain-containing protein n=1 Tax=Haloparvum sp. PAK95 TaxID=3418962 RepID=UPI003D2EE019